MKRCDYMRGKLFCPEAEVKRFKRYVYGFGICKIQWDEERKHAAVVELRSLILPGNITGNFTDNINCKIVHGNMLITKEMSKYQSCAVASLLNNFILH